MQQRDGPFDDPAVDTETGAAFASAFSKPGLNRFHLGECRVFGSGPFSVVTFGVSRGGCGGGGGGSLRVRTFVV